MLESLVDSRSCFHEVGVFFFFFLESHLNFVIPIMLISSCVCLARGWEMSLPSPNFMGNYLQMIHFEMATNLLGPKTHTQEI